MLFANATGDPQQAYIADGMTASVISYLSRIRDAFVVAAATAYSYKNKPVNLQQLGTDLGVRFVLQGSVRRGGNIIRINAQLAGTQTNAQLWTQTFEGDQANPKFRAGLMPKPRSTSPPEYKAYFEEKYLPAVRQAGLSE